MYMPTYTKHRYAHIYTIYIMCIYCVLYMYVCICIHNIYIYKIYNT